IRLVDRLDSGERPVRRTIVDEENHPSDIGLAERLLDALDQEVEEGFLVMDGDHDGDGRSDRDSHGQDPDPHPKWAGSARASPARQDLEALSGRGGMKL